MLKDCSREFFRINAIERDSRYLEIFLGTIRWLLILSSHIRIVPLICIKMSPPTCENEIRGARDEDSVQVMCDPSMSLIYIVVDELNEITKLAGSVMSPDVQNQ